MAETLLISTATHIVCRFCLPEKGGSLPHVAQCIDDFLTSFVCHKVFTDACERGIQTHTLTFLLQRTAPVWKDAIEAAARGGHLHILRWALELERSRGPWKADFENALQVAATYGHLDVVQWLLEYERHTMPGMKAGYFKFAWLNSIYEALGSAAEHGHLEVVKFLYNHTWFGNPMDRAVINGHLAVVQWLYHTNSQSCMVHAVDTAAKNGHFETLQWLHSTQLFKCTTAALNGAAENGHFEIVKWLHQTENEVSKDALSHAAMNGHFEIVKWLYNNIRISFYGYGVKFAARHGRLDIVQWFHEYYPHSFSEEPMNLAALGGQMEVLTWLHEHRSEGCTEAASYYAARNGHLNVVQWLHEHYSSKFDARVMDDAAENGHLQIVRWLHENRSEGCSKRAMGSAADNGHLDVMLYLLENRSEGFSGNAMETPQNIEILCLFRDMDSDDSRSGSQSNQQQLQRLKVVFEERPDFCRGCLRSLAEIACEKGNLKILDWLTPFGLELRSTIPIRNAVCGGDLALVRWFYRNRYKVDEPDLLELALDVDVARWLYDHGHQITSHELVETAARRQNGPLMRWLIEHGPPLDLATATTLLTKYSYFEVAWILAEEDRVCLVLELLRNNNDNNRDLIWWILRHTEIKDQDSQRSIRNAVKDAPSNALTWLQDNLSAEEACKWVFQHTGKRSTGDFTVDEGKTATRRRVQTLAQKLVDAGFTQHLK